VLYRDWIGFLLEQLVEIGDRRWKIGDRGSGRSVLVKIFSPLFTLSSGSLDLDPSSGATEPYQTEPNRLTFNSRLITVQQTVFRLLPAVFGMVWYGMVWSGLAGSSSTCAVSWQDQDLLITRPTRPVKYKFSCSQARNSDRELKRKEFKLNESRRNAHRAFWQISLICWQLAVKTNGQKRGRTMR